MTQHDDHLQQSSARVDPEFVNRDPTEAEYEAAHVDGEFMRVIQRDGVFGGYILLRDGTHAWIASFHDECGRQVSHPADASMACAFVNGLVLAYPMSLQHTLH